MNKQEGEIINKVANSPLVTFNLEDYYPKEERIVYDIRDNLFQEAILREKDFRAFVKEHDWAQYQDKLVALTCSVDAIVPTWAYMLLTSKLEPYAKMLVYGSLEVLEATLFKEALSRVNPEEFQDAKVVIKGCGKYPVPIFAYTEITRMLRPYVGSLMYGEPCSTVPLYKKPKL
ncbi:DUF2480 family protein [Catalinimonas niigatensis]|uniref:DUF2480 family protein n=1 Tax=Catalinimonas niigatensis TaxID=1397264 RepID=UPI002665E473|nr:DUF2480 family protein [Catalinimonas niigatensis]WPP52191.1 DUF2480 family protein [Catalinimonas niigatensis]